MHSDKNIYGVDLGKPVTPLMARDALVECFFQAHSADSGLGADDSLDNKKYCRDIVRKAFADAEEDFENPTKQSILSAMSKLKDFSANFRDPAIIEKHAAEMMKIAEKIK